MKRRVQPSEQLMSLARRQGGALSADQVGAHGLGRHSVARLVGEGRWQRLSSGVYAATEEPLSWIGTAWAGVLIGGRGACVAGTAAVHLAGLVEPPAVIDIGVVRGRDRRCDNRWRLRQFSPGIRAPATGEPPRLSVEDALIDVCSDLSSDEVIGLVVKAVQSRATRTAWLTRRLQERRQVSHRQLLTELLGDVAVGAESVLEVRYLRDVERAHRLPVAVRQHRSARGHVVDALYEDYATVVELDGRLGHEGMGRFRDMDRDNQAAVLGLRTLRFGYRDVVRRPCVVADQVGAVLRQSGWSGRPTRCFRCRRVQ